MTDSQYAASINAEVRKYRNNIDDLKKHRDSLVTQLDNLRSKRKAAIIKMGGVVWTNNISASQYDPDRYPVYEPTKALKGVFKIAQYVVLNIPTASGYPSSWTYRYDKAKGDPKKGYWFDYDIQSSTSQTITTNGNMTFTANPIGWVEDPTYASPYLVPVDLCPALASYNDAIKAMQDRIGTVDAKIQGVKNQINDYKQSISLIKSDGTLSLNPIADFKYNVGSVREAYFSQNTDFLNTYSGIASDGKKGIPNGSGTNFPTAVTNAMQLWHDGKSNKGMIQTSTLLLNQGITGITPNSGYTPQKATGFQFHYNPGSVEMNYQGITGVDTNFEGLGLDQFNAIGATTGTSATISFSVLINRMYDMKYYDPSTGHLRSDVDKNLYYPRQPSTNEQKDIYNKGTMYDLEYLLRTLLGFSASVRMGRNSFVDGTSADLGWTTGVPVELHLGKSLRYFVWIGSISVNHVIFNEHMVPVFTQVGITANRIPDNAVPLTFGKDSPEYIASAVSNAKTTDEAVAKLQDLYKTGVGFGKP